MFAIFIFFHSNPHLITNLNLLGNAINFIEFIYLHTFIYFLYFINMPHYVFILNYLTAFILSINYWILALSSPFTSFDIFLSSWQNNILDRSCHACWTRSFSVEAAAIIFDNTFGFIYLTCVVLFLTPNNLLIFLNLFLMVE